MGAVWGNKIKITIFGESHSEAIGIVVDGLPSGVNLDMEEVKREMARRAPNGGEFSTPRKEADEVEIVSGYFDGKTTGTPLCGIIKNTNTKSKDYSLLKEVFRPGHSDYGYYLKSGGNNDYRGGGHSSGRLTAPIVFCGAICKQLLREKGISIGSHISSIANIKDETFPIDFDSEKLEKLTGEVFPLLDKSKFETMRSAILEAREQGDSVGGVIECMISGLEGGVGEPFFDSIESRLASLLFSVPAVKGVQFGKGYKLTEMKGSEANDAFEFVSGKVVTKTNNNGGILGGISTGMPIVFDVAIKPTASIFKEQDSINITTGENTKLKIQGRHDSCIVVRAVPVIEAVAAIAIYDFLR
ncbi:MAG: chorismate synthase [Clostridia bacterium]|nr:chorismate synthase [Clostridia bacterium]MDE7328375.1 chorismate synthase [Clostridia bacterium]